MKKSTLFIVLVILLNMTMNAQNSINLTQGQKTHLLNKSVSTIKQSAMGQDMEIKSDVVLDIDIEVKSISPDIHLTHTIKRIQLKTDAMGISVEFDSEKNENRENIMFQSLINTLNKPFDFHITTTGMSIENKQSDPSFDAVKNLLGDIDELNSEIIVAVPKSIKIGDHWIDEQNKDANNRGIFEYTVKSITNEEAVLTFNGNIDKKQNKSFQGMEATVTGNTTSKGELTVNMKTGLIKEKKAELVSKGTTEVMGQNIPFTVTKSSFSSIK